MTEEINYPETVSEVCDAAATRKAQVDAVADDIQRRMDEHGIPNLPPPGVSDPYEAARRADPAATLRAAAARLRVLAAEATPGPWEFYGLDRVVRRNGSIPGLPIAVMSADANGADAVWASRLNPALAEPLAAWLESAAVDAEQIGPDPRALAFARAVLGDAPADDEGGA